MKKIVIAGVVAAVIGGAAVLEAQEAPKMPEPQKEHSWLQQLVGEWDYVAEMYMEPDKPPQKSKGTEVVRPVGGFWVIAENKGTFMDKPFHGVLTLGYDPADKEYVGTWVDSFNDRLWMYEGAVVGNTLTLETEGPCPMSPGKTFQFKEVIEVKDKDHKIFTSTMQGDDSKWKTNIVIHYTRKK